jgi:phosphatidylserine/phosphatidylglycerophosphate/cardiolipin synthase-like enzyme
MHNKFVVIDNQDTTSDTDDWLWTGSWNATESGNNNDAQNIIEIQDKSLANAYTIEFNEMWGSNTQTPNAANSRFGAHKLNNTPHYFVVNGTPIELYFSPSDGTTGKIIKTLYKATESIDFALLTFTRNDIANVLTTIYRSGIKVRGVIDNRTDSGSEYDTLFARGIDIHLKANLSGLLHHKYAVIDANGNDANKYLITGSHNWSSSAENSNNENTLIIQSSRLVNLYLQEFSVRYKDAGGTDVLVNVEQVGTSVPKNYELTQNYPNPFNPTTSFKFYIPHFSVVNIKIFDLLGREIATLVNESKPAGVYKVNWNASNTVSGVYFYRLQAGSIMLVKKLMLLK